MKVKELRGLIYSTYDTEADMAKEMNWSRQRLSRITNGQKEPNIEELNALAKLLGKSVEDISQIFLRYKSPNRQHSKSNREGHKIDSKTSAKRSL